MERPVLPLTVVGPQPVRVVGKEKIVADEGRSLLRAAQSWRENFPSTVTPLHVRSIHKLDAVGTAVRHNGNEGLVTKRRLF